MQGRNVRACEMIRHGHELQMIIEVKKESVSKKRRASSWLLIGRTNSGEDLTSSLETNLKIFWRSVHPDVGCYRTYLTTPYAHLACTLGERKTTAFRGSHHLNRGKGSLWKSSTTRAVAGANR